MLDDLEQLRNRWLAGMLIDTQETVNTDNCGEMADSVVEADTHVPSNVASFGVYVGCDISLVCV